MMKLFLWFSANIETETTFKIYVIAPDLAAARRLVDRMPANSPEVLALVRKTDPQVFETPWAEVNVSHAGRAMSWCYGDKRT